MKIVKASHEIMGSSGNGIELLKLIEYAGRTCYKSTDLITNDSAKKFVKMLIDRGHEAMIEHGFISVKFICDRGVSHELVRHRVASFAQESTRYCNYSKDRFGGEITVIDPEFWDEESYEYSVWFNVCANCEEEYLWFMSRPNVTAQMARSILPNSLKTEIVISANPREWRHIFKLRTPSTAHPQMQRLMRPCLDEFKEKFPILFDDIVY